MSKKLEYIASETKKNDEKLPACFTAADCMYRTMLKNCSFKHPCRHKKDNNFTYVRNDNDDDEITTGDDIQGKKLAKIIRQWR
jgi:hypothetical protein